MKIRSSTQGPIELMVLTTMARVGLKVVSRVVDAESNVVSLW